MFSKMDDQHDQLLEFRCGQVLERSLFEVTICKENILGDVRTAQGNQGALLGNWISPLPPASSSDPIHLLSAWDQPRGNKLGICLPGQILDSQGRGETVNETHPLVMTNIAVENGHRNSGKT